MTASARLASYASFDIFDTLLTRAVGDPKDVFLLLGDRLRRAGGIGCSAEIFARQRGFAEDRANSIHGRHPTLEEIYREVLRGMGREESLAEAFAAEELVLEAELSREIPGAKRMLEAARANGQSVLFLTDTNMPASFIEKLLSRYGMYEPQDRLFASCEAGVDKARGMLFPFVADRLGVPARAITHVGNSAVADIRNGRLSGWKVRHEPAANLNRYEEALQSDSFATGGLSSLLAGCSRLARLADLETDERGQTINVVTAGVGAPMLIAWMLWLLRSATRDGIARLYFVSRDGQILLDIVRRLQGLFDSPIECRYLYVGRQALLRAGSTELVLRDSLRLTTCRICDVAESLGLTDSQTQSMLPPRLRDPATWTRALSLPERDELRTSMASEQGRSLLQQSCTEARAAALGYLEQEGWGESVPFGVVDVGWRASLAGALTDVLHGSALSAPSKYYYFGLGNDAHRVAGPLAAPRLSAWFYDDASHHGHLPYLNATSALVETFCSGTHGAVIGYSRTETGVEVNLRSDVSPMQQWGLPQIRRVMAAFVDAFVEAIPSGSDAAVLDTDLRRSIRRVMELFWLHPSAREVRHWGTFPVEVTITNTLVLPLAERLSMVRLLGSLVRRGSPRSHHSWPKGTALRSSLPVRVFLTLRWRLRPAMDRLKRRLYWLRARSGWAKA